METITEDMYISIGYFLKSRRISLGISREDFCRMMGITINTLLRWEEDYLDGICLEDMKLLAKILAYNPIIFINGVPLEAYEDWNNFINQDFIF